MKNVFLVLNLLVVCSSAQASVWNGVFKYSQSYACLGLDGVPIAHETTLASKCCSGGILGSSDPSCRSSIITNTAGPATTAGQGVTLANHVINTTLNMHGNSTDFDTQVPLTHDNGVNPGAGAAMTAGTSISDSEKGDGSGSSAGAMASGIGSGKSGAGKSNGSLGGAAGLGVGNASGTSGLSKANTASGSNGKDSAGGYVGGGKKGDGSGYGMNGGFGSFGADKGAGAGDAGKDYEFGETGKDGLAAGAETSGDDDGRGSAEDPSDYFNRTNKSDNIFKIVSARYMKKKSLWTIPQKLPEDLKQKKI